MGDSIFTGSHMNHRTFQEDDYWASFQSTIVSGQVISIEEMTRRSMDAEEMTREPPMRATEETTTRSANAEETTMSVGELSSTIDDEEENPCNINIDANRTFALAELDENFYDCPSFEKSPANLVRPPTSSNVMFSPRLYRQPRFYEVQFSSPPKTNNNSNISININHLASPRKQRPASARRISPAKMLSMSTAGDSSPSANMKTGSLLVQMIDDFKDLDEHAQSTPKLSSDSGNPSSRGSFSEVSTFDPIDQVRKTLDFYNAETIILSQNPTNQNNSASVSKQSVDVSVSNKENFYAGRYCTFVASRKAMKKTPKKVWSRTGKVALVKQFFENRVNDSIQLYKSRIPLPIRKASQLPSHVKKSPQAKTGALGSPSYQIRKSYKLVASRSYNVSVRTHPSSATSFSSSGSTSFLTRNQPKPSRTSRIQSCSDAANAEITSIDETCKSHSTGELSADSLSSIKAVHSGKITKRKYSKIGKEEPQQKTFSLKNISAINKRRSVGLELKINSSPVKPVSEIRKLFTPSKRAGISSGIITQKQVPHLAVPKIVITHH